MVSVRPVPRLRLRLDRVSVANNSRKVACYFSRAHTSTTHTYIAKRAVGGGTGTINFAIQQNALTVCFRSTGSSIVSRQCCGFTFRKDSKTFVNSDHFMVFGKRKACEKLYGRTQTNHKNPFSSQVVSFQTDLHQKPIRTERSKRNHIFLCKRIVMYHIE